MKMWQI